MSLARLAVFGHQWKVYLSGAAGFLFAASAASTVARKPSTL
jgi:hypothetical protein